MMRNERLVIELAMGPLGAPGRHRRFEMFSLVQMSEIVTGR
jgi:hypothetical protein